MKPPFAKKHLLNLVKASGHEILARHAEETALEISLSAVDTTALMISFYHNTRAEGCDPSKGEDMLHYECGYFEPDFQLNITRQMETKLEGEHLDIWLLMLNINFCPDDVLRECPKSGDACHDPQGIAEFQSRIQNSPGFLEVRNRTPREVKLISWRDRY